MANYEKQVNYEPSGDDPESAKGALRRLPHPPIKSKTIN